MIDAAAERARLAARLAHRLESSLLLVREAAERGDLDRLPEHLDDLALRARGLARCCALGASAAPALRDALADWMGAGAAWAEEGDEIEVRAAPGHGVGDTVELGEPLVRLLAAEAGAVLVSWAPDRARIRF